MNTQQTGMQRPSQPISKSGGYITKRIGSTTYRVKVVFTAEGKETVEDKLLRMLRNEVSAGGAK